MALALPGPLVDKISGSVKGTNFAPVGPLQVVRGRARSNRPRRSLQLALLEAMRQRAPEWRGLSVVKRDEWAAYADTVTFTNSLGNVYKITGQAHYVRSAIYYSSRGVFTVFNVPTDSGLPSLPVITFDVAAGSLRIFDIVPGPAGGSEIRGSVYWSTTRSRTRPSGLVKDDFVWQGDPLPFVIASGISSPFAAGTLANAHVRLRLSDDKQRITTQQIYRIPFTAV